MSAVKISAEQRRNLDGAIVRFLLKQKSSRRALQIQRAEEVMRALSALPSGKSDMRYVDNALQRLRKDGRIKIIDGGWIAA